ncbi:hypothetical protein BDQ17DRAFT_1326755 [Cyathus striatus]|nr:hypothetical protein BDQ17DRAFT_1326755 [Cyathus striatus]
MLSTALESSSQGPELKLLMVQETTRSNANFTLFVQSTTDAIRPIDERMESGNAVDFQDTMQRCASSYSLKTGTTFFSSAIHYPAHTSVAHLLSASEVGGYQSFFGVFKDNAKVYMHVKETFLDTVLEHAPERNRLKHAARERFGGKGDISLYRLLTASSCSDTLLTQRTEVTEKLCKEVLSKVGPEICPTYAYETMKEVSSFIVLLNDERKVCSMGPVEEYQEIEDGRWGQARY